MKSQSDQACSLGASRGKCRSIRIKYVRWFGFQPVNVISFLLPPCVQPVEDVFVARLVHLFLFDAVVSIAKNKCVEA